MKPWQKQLEKLLVLVQPKLGTMTALVGPHLFKGKWNVLLLCICGSCVRCKAADWLNATRRPWCCRKCSTRRNGIITSPSEPGIEWLDYYRRS